MSLIILYHSAMLSAQGWVRLTTKHISIAINIKPSHNKLGFIYDVIVLEDDIHVHRL